MSKVCRLKNKRDTQEACLSYFLAGRVGSADIRDLIPGVGHGLF